MPWGWQRNYHTARRKKKAISFAHELHVKPGTIRDWPAFAKWHYRSHHLGFVKKVFLLLHGVVPVGICVFSSPAASLSLRSRAFGLSRARSRVAMSALNQQLWLLQRVVIHPSYRGAGIASAFIRECCERCPVRWIETLSAMGQIHPFFERAGFRRIGMIRKPLQASPKRNLSHGAYSGKIQLSQETLRKSRFSEPVYYLWENQDRTDRARVS